MGKRCQVLQQIVKECAYKRMMRGPAPKPIPGVNRSCAQQHLEIRPPLLSSSTMLSSETALSTNLKEFPEQIFGLSSLRMQGYSETRNGIGGLRTQYASRRPTASCNRMASLCRRPRTPCIGETNSQRWLPKTPGYHVQRLPKTIREVKTTAIIAVNSDVDCNLDLPFQKSLFAASSIP